MLELSEDVLQGNNLDVPVPILNQFQFFGSWTTACTSTYCHFSPGQTLSRAFSLTEDRNLAFTQASTHGFNTSKGRFFALDFDFANEGTNGSVRRLILIRSDTKKIYLVGAVLEPAHGEETLAIQPFIDQRFCERRHAPATVHQRTTGRKPA